MVRARRMLGGILVLAGICQTPARAQSPSADSAKRAAARTPSRPNVRQQSPVQGPVVDSTRLQMRVTLDTLIPGRPVTILFNRAPVDSAITVRFDGLTAGPPTFLARDLVSVTVPDSIRGPQTTLEVIAPSTPGRIVSATVPVRGPTVPTTTQAQLSRGTVYIIVAAFGVLFALGAWRQRRQSRANEVAKLELERAKDAAKLELDVAVAKVNELNELRFNNEVQARPPSSRSSMAEQGAPPHSQGNAGAGGDAKVIAPPVPKELIEIVAADQAILWAGIGMTAQANLPTTYELLRGMLEESPQDKEELLPALHEGRFTEVAELLLRRRGREAIVAAVARRYAEESTRTTPVHEALSRLPFAGVISTAWDSIIERSFLQTRPNAAVIYPGASDSRSTPPPFPQTFVIARPFGSIARPESFLFTNDEAVAAMQRSRNFRRTLAAMLGSRSVLFLGVSPRSIQDLLSGAQLTLSDRPNFALVPAQDATPLQRELFLSKFNITLIPFDPSPGFPEVGLFVAALCEAVGRASQASAPTPSFQEAALTSATLTNIGVFRTLTVQFNPRWNVILGNNGSGKSTLLRAIALGLCGDDADASKSAKKLLRTGCDDGTIELQVGATKYTTRLFRDGDGVRVESQFTALQQGSWVVLGFPPLRGVSTHDPAGVGPAGAPRPVVADLRPLIRGSIDERLNDLKQWLVNIDAGRRSTDSAEQLLSERLHTSFWRLLQKLTPGVRIEPGEVRSATWEVTVKTEDGTVSIDQVSQGMSSIFGWLGAALQRMHEIHRNSDDPENAPALLLVDEIDAHLHPEWQQRLVALVREHFTRLQIIATSHSPLVVAGMTSNEVFVASRDDDDRTKVTVERVPKDVPFELLRFDQILTSPLFGLTSTRSEATKKEYVKLAAKPESERTVEEQKRYETLRAMLLDSAQPQSTAQGRETAKVVREVVSAAIRENADPVELSKQGKLTPEVAEELKARLAAIAPAEPVTTAPPRTQQ